MSLVFEKLATKEEFYVFRASIPGGWLVAMKYHEHDTKEQWECGNDSGYGFGWGWGLGYGGMTFVPDPGHKWDGGSSWLDR